MSKRLKATLTRAAGSWPLGRYILVFRARYATKPTTQPPRRLGVASRSVWAKNSLTM